MATAGLRGAAATAARDSLIRLRTRRAEYRELLLYRRALAFRAVYFFAS
jgi:hypothetical protein